MHCAYTNPVITFCHSNAGLFLVQIRGRVRGLIDGKYGSAAFSREFAFGSPAASIRGRAMYVDSVFTVDVWGLYSSPKEILHVAELLRYDGSFLFHDMTAQLHPVEYAAHEQTPDCIFHIGRGHTGSYISGETWGIMTLKTKYLAPRNGSASDRGVARTASISCINVHISLLHEPCLVNVQSSRATCCRLASTMQLSRSLSEDLLDQAG